MSLAFGTVRSPTEKSALRAAIVLVVLLVAIVATGVLANLLAREHLPDPVVTIGP